MTKSQFWILTCTIVLVSPLFLAEIYLSRLVRNDERQAVILEKIAQEGSEYTTRWQQLAVRTYQMSQQDPVLKDVLTLNHINVKPKDATSPSTPAAPEPASGAPAPSAK